MIRAAAVAVLLAACGGTAPEPEKPARQRPPPPLRELLPPGADWILEARPKALWATPEVRRALAGSITDPDLLDHARRTGVDLRKVTEAVAAGYSGSVVWIARRGHDPAEVAGKLRARLRPVERDDPRRGIVGMLRDRPVALRRLGPRAIAFWKGAGGEAGAGPLDRLSRRPAADPVIRSLSSRLRDMPLRYLHLGPLELPEDSGAGVVLSRIRRAGFGLRPADGRLRVRVILVGELPGTADENLRALVDSLGSSGLGRAFGADAAARRAGITVTPGGAELALRFEPAEVDLGVRTLFVEDLRGLFGTP